MIPQTEHDQLQNLRGYYAGFVSRMIACIVDIAIMNICLLFIGWIISIFFALINYSQNLGISTQMPDFYRSFIEFLTQPLFISIFIFIFICIYEVFFWMFSGHTPGKALLGLRVIPRYGGKMSFSRSMIRFLGYIPSFLSLGIGFLWIIIDDQRQAWQDSIAKTYVIYSWDAKLDETFLKKHLNSVKHKSTQ